jgi:hypothetical protein
MSILKRSLEKQHSTLCWTILTSQVHLPVLNTKACRSRKNNFLSAFPEGFFGKKFLEEERNYKVQAHELARSLLNTDVLESFIEEQNFDEICRRALKVVNATNLIFPNEKMALKDGLQNSDAARQFCTTLAGLLYGQDALELRFQSFIASLEEMGADKWTTATYFLFFIHPSEYVFIKPTVTQHAAQLCGYEINYRPQLNWKTYRSVLDFSEYLRSELADLKPRDMIDVQSFMWCIGPSV